MTDSHCRTVKNHLEACLRDLVYSAPEEFSEPGSPGLSQDPPQFTTCGKPPGRRERL
jgi:hypothetical protein